MSFKKTVLIPLSIILAIILVLGFVSWWQMQKFQRTISGGTPIRFDFSNASPDPSQPETFNEFVAPAGDLKVTYPNSWESIQHMDFNFKALDTEKTETLFYGIKTDVMQMTMGWFIIQELEINTEKSLEEIFEEIKIDLQNNDIEIKIDSLEINENTVLFEIVQTGTVYSLQGKVKIILTDENAYSVVVFSLFDGWGSFRTEAMEILNSTQAL